MIYATSTYGNWSVQLNWNADLWRSFFTGDADFITALNHVELRPDTILDVFPNDVALRKAVSSQDYGIEWNWLKPYPGYPVIDGRTY